jgi:hypothetical protein
MNSRVAFVICSPLLTIAGAATTIIAPMLLDAPSFVHFALLNSVFTYLAEFDLGLARTADRLLPGQSADAAMTTGGMLLFGRYSLALTLLLIGALFVTDPLMLVATIGGIAMLLGNGPLSLYRARGNTKWFAVAALLMQFGLTLPRLFGLLLDGVRGSFLGMLLWSGIACVVLNVRVVATVQVCLVALPGLFVRSVPLFLYSAAWLAYLFANRWISWWVSGSATDAGLFAFGANLTMVAVGVVIAWSQPYYPRYLAKADPFGLARELYVLLSIGTVGTIIGTIGCRLVLHIVFPNFAAAAGVTAALLIATIPLGLSAWLVPLVIARSNRPLEALSFPVCLMVMYGLMVVLNHWLGINGQAWACLPPALLLFAFQLALVTENGLLGRLYAVFMWVACVAASGVGVLVWCLMF